MTGRRHRQVRRDGRVVLEERQTTGDLDAINIIEKNAFCDGKKTVAIISDAASTGISLHADRRRSNTRRRVHFTIELPWSADKAVQQLGRSHRSNQYHGPIYRLIATELGGERRFAAAVAKRLRSLGALTKGDRRAATAQDMSSFDIDTKYGRKALKELMTCIASDQLPFGTNRDIILTNVPEGQLKDMITTAIPDNVTCVACLKAIREKLSSRAVKSVGTFLNGILGLVVAEQNLVFAAFAATTQQVVQRAREEGKYTDGIEEIHGSDIQRTGPPQDLGAQVQLHTITVDRGVSLARAEELYQQAKDAHEDAEVFFMMSRASGQKARCVLAVRLQGDKDVFMVTRPNVGRVQRRQPRGELFSKYKRASIDDVAELWEEIYDSSINQCSHGPQCKTQDCPAGRRISSVAILTGNVVQHWTRLAHVLKQNTSNVYKKDKTVRVVRCQVGEERIVGIQWPSVLIDLLPSILTPPEAQTIPKVTEDTSAKLQAYKIQLQVGTQNILQAYSQDLTRMGVSTSELLRKLGARNEELLGECAKKLQAYAARLSNEQAAKQQAAHAEMMEQRKKRDVPSSIEPPAAVDAKLKRKLFTAPRTIQSFFDKPAKLAVTAQPLKDVNSETDSKYQMDTAADDEGPSIMIELEAGSDTTSDDGRKQTDAAAKSKPSKSRNAKRLKHPTKTSQSRPKKAKSSQQPSIKSFFGQ
eukprot:TRINITY_DN8274_c0_g1_i1.p1 TRINITY_DN8274_c0_g1~~TRINITY_DN8274_c0_g1_i1.p1  ORF type:complete len:700 (+),score=137.74 TRINITY_DN8274_c0_g1_i1:3-2102(+)